MKRLLLPLIILVAVSATAIGLSNAFFSDEEVSTGNTFQAGAIDLKVDNTSYYNGELNQDTTFGPVDLNGETYRFFNFLDIKPGDWGEDTISLRVDTNDAWACYNVTLTSNDDKSCTEPENIDDPACPTPSPEPDADLFDGELAQFVQMVIWKDDGDNVLESDEPPLANGPISEVAPLLEGALADAQGGILGLQNNPMLGETVYYLGKAWCFGTLGLVPVAAGAGVNPTVASGITCDGSGLNNATQTDIVTADITFSAIQSRNNRGYVCFAEPTPTPLACTDGPLYVSLNTSQTQGSLKIGGPITDPTRTDPTYMLGAPDGQFYSIGKGGVVTVAFNGVVQDKTGPDISVHEITGGRDSYPEEKVEVFVSNDNLTYTSIGNATSEPGGGGDGVTYLDINGAVANVKYVKLVDATNFAPHLNTADGYDIDAIDAAFGLCQ